VEWELAQDGDDEVQRELAQDDDDELQQEPLVEACQEVVVEEQFQEER